MSNSQVKDTTIEYLEPESNQMPIRSERPAFDLETAYRALIQSFVRQDSDDRGSIRIIQNTVESVEEKKHS